MSSSPDERLFPAKVAAAFTSLAVLIGLFFVTLVRGPMAHTAAYGIVCLTGVSSAGRHIGVDAGGINRELVLENDAALGSVNANLRHYRQGADALAKADHGWLERLVTRRVPLSRAVEALTTGSDDVKVVITLDG